MDILDLWSSRSMQCVYEMQFCARRQSSLIVDHKPLDVITEQAKPGWLIRLMVKVLFLGLLLVRGRSSLRLCPSGSY
jgi:hypothetical protein